jgi:ribosomal protein S18 acetylase RimI-like enzyme
VQRPELARYAEGWGRSDDIGFAAVDERSRQPIGAAWSRLLTGANKGYGHIDDTTPELSVAIEPPYRGRGIGTALLAALMKEAELRYRAISLSVARDNAAARLYRRLGFEIVRASGGAMTMRKGFPRSASKEFRTAR